MHKFAELLNDMSVMSMRSTLQARFAHVQLVCTNESISKRLKFNIEVGVQ